MAKNKYLFFIISISTFYSFNFIRIAAFMMQIAL
jgi:hypothetical protein